MKNGYDVLNIALSIFIIQNTISVWKKNKTQSFSYNL